MINIQGIPIVAARIAAELKSKKAIATSPKGPAAADTVEVPESTDRGRGTRRPHNTRRKAA